MKKNKQNIKSWSVDLTILILIIGTIFGAFLGCFPLKTPDGARYSEIAREMVARHQYITPYLNGIKYFEKPALFYWMQSTSINLFGLSEWSMRFMNAFMGLLGCLMVYVGGRKLYDRRTGFLASLILATTGLSFFMAHFITLDMTFTAFLTGALLSFIIGVRPPPGKQRNGYMWLMYVFAALAVMTKGLIGMLFPGIIIFLWILMFNKWRDIKTYCLPTGILIFLIIAAPWHILIQLKHPEFLHFYFVDQHFLRYLTDYADRYQPLWYLPTILIAGALPWLIFLIQAIKYHFPKSWQSRHQHEAAIFFMLWVILIYIFYTFSRSQLIPYLLPVFPAIAILIGNYLAKHWRPKIFWSIFIIVTILLIGGYCGYSKIIEQFSTKPLALKLKPLLRPDDEVAIYDTYYQDLPFYLQRQVTVVIWKNELSFGIKHQQEAKQWMIDTNTLWQRWNSNKRMFMVLNKENYPGMKATHTNVYLIAKSGDQVLITNQPRH